MSAVTDCLFDTPGIILAIVHTSEILPFFYIYIFLDIDICFIGFWMGMGFDQTGSYLCTCIVSGM